MSVYISVKDKNGILSVHNAEPYQKSAYLAYMAGKFKYINFGYPNNIKFRLKAFDYGKLKGDYSSFCTLVNGMGENIILSNDKILIDVYTSIKNKLLKSGGSSRKKNKKKSTKKSKK